MAKAAHPAVTLWPRAEPFTYGIFQVHPHPRLAVHNIKKLVSYAKSKGKSGYPRLSYPVWKHVACSKLQLTEELAWVLFHTCLSMATTHNEKLKEMEERIFCSQTAAESERIRGMQSVELFAFVIFLFIQQINKISLRASAVSANAEWPGSHNRSSELDSGRSTPIRPCRNLDEQYHLQFMTENLAELLDLLAEPDSHSGNNIEAYLSEEAVESLNLILEGTVDQCRSLNSFSELIHMPAILPATGYSKTTRTYQLRGMHSWIRSWLAPNPFSVENCIRSGRRLQWRLPYQGSTDSGTNSGSGCQQQQQQDSSKRQKIATNTHQVPRTGGRSGNKLVIMSMISRQIIARSSATLDGATLKIHRAHCSYLYLLSPMRSVTLDKCRKLTIVLGPIENTLQLNHCEDCLIIACCLRAVLVACRRCTLHLCIQSRPILIQPPVPNAAAGTASSNVTASGVSGNGGISSASGQSASAPGTPTPGGGASSVTQLGNEEILLAPYHTTYLRLLDHMARVNLSIRVNYWDQPFLLGQDSNRHETIQQQPTSNTLAGKGRCWDLLLPAHFYPFNIPLLLPARLESTLPEGGKSAYNNGLDLSAALVTDTHRFFVENNEHGLEDYISMVNTRLPIPLPTPYLMALRERSAIYQKWPQHIANARLTAEQRQLFGTLVDQRFRQWLSESGNLRQLQLLELSTGHAGSAQSCNANGNYNEANGVPPVGSSRATNGMNTSSGDKVGGGTRPSSQTGAKYLHFGSPRGDRSRSGTAHDSQTLNESCLS
ncbi:unnamed protein product [Calicophoron daubneyi]|uniref:C-CAP/cofactor C-like domain-containing protein n=1 Tax=Calicophoron daubneyi TaxID=300641 RepID=A0AAV2U003_CALDB